MDLFSSTLSLMQTNARINRNRVNFFATNHNFKLSTYLIMSGIAISSFGQDTINITAVSTEMFSLNPSRSTWTRHYSVTSHSEKKAVQSLSYQDRVGPAINQIQKNLRPEDLYQYNYSGEFNMSFRSDLRNKSSLQYRNVSKIIRDKVSL